MKLRLFLIAVTTILATSLSPGEDRFRDNIRPLFAKHCVDCHGNDERESGISLTDRASLLRGGDHGQPSLVPGNPKASFLLNVVRGDDPDLRMPPEGDLLTKAQIEMLTRWIAEGADWPGQMDATADDLKSDHWSLQTPVKPTVPDDVDDVNPIDAFIRHKLATVGLDGSPMADSVTLIRRASFILTGVPPTIDQLDAIESDPRGFDLAYEQLIDELLASPRYGERWAQHWLDVIRWAETVGFETNAERKQAWPYRDWVIQSFNDDLPYNEFIAHQIVGDQLGSDAALGFLVSGPANLPGQIGRDEEAMRQARQDELDEVIRTVSQGLFGLTVGCARCHNHKFDPILQKDYYAMQAIFSGMTYGQRRWRGAKNDDWTNQIPAARERLSRAKDELEQLRKRHGLSPPLGAIATFSFDPIEAQSIRVEIAATNDNQPASLYELRALTVGGDVNVALASRGGNPSASSFALSNQTRHFDNLVDGSVDRRQAFPWVAADKGSAWVQIDFAETATIDRIAWEYGNNSPADFSVKVKVNEPDHGVTDDWIVVAKGDNRLPRFDDTRSAETVQLSGLSTDQVIQVVEKVNQVRSLQATLNRLSNGPQLYAAGFSTNPEPTWQLKRGDPMQRKALVAPSTPIVLGSLGVDDGDPEFRRRQALVEHLTSPEHPLTARVIVNRIWQHHFGTGLVDTPSDFGKMGSLPSHPELLDWLATEFVDRGWSIKTLHRMIVTSKAFRQTSTPVRAGQEIDADARLLWRFPPRRIEAEAIRDSILQASGKLNLTMGGRGFDLFRQRGGLSDYIAKETFDETGWRRMIYAHKIRMQSVDIFGTFDCPDAGQMKPRRTQSITPLQSLSLLNSPFVNRQAKFFADRVRRESSDDLAEQIDQAFRIALSRPATERETQRLIPLVQNEGLHQLCRVLFNTSEFLYIR